MVTAKELVLKTMVMFLLVAGCTTVRIETSSVDKDAFLSDYQTFGFYDLKEGVNVPQGIDLQRVQILKDAISSELEQAGLASVENPDLWINIGIVLEEKVQTRQTDIREAPLYIGQRRYSWKSEEVVVDEYRLGTVSVDFVDANEDKMVAQAVATGVVEENDKNLERQINRGITKLFDQLWNENQD